jgi:Ribbon-helix-helix domain
MSKEGVNCTLVQASVAFCGHMYAYMLLSMLMKRTALFLKEQQLEKLQKLSEKTGAPIAELVRRAIDVYLLSRKKELK